MTSLDELQRTYQDVFDFVQNHLDTDFYSDSRIFDLGKRFGELARLFDEAHPYALPTLPQIMTYSSHLLFERGESLYRSGRVSITNALHSELLVDLFGIVDTEMVSFRCTLDGGIEETSCGCTDWKETAHCKHVIALMFAAMETGDTTKYKIIQEKLDELCNLSRFSSGAS